MERKLESEIVREICDWLDKEGYFFWRNNTIPVFQKDRYGGRMRRLPKYTPQGLPDIIILEQGLFIGVEVKRPNRNTGGRAASHMPLRESQQDMRAKILSHGGAYHVVTSLQELKDRVDLLPLPLRPIPDYIGSAK